MAVTDEGAARALVLEATGDDFALVSGVFLHGARVAAHLRDARQVWVFAAPDDEAAVRLMDSLPAEDGTRVIGIVPGAAEGWDASQRETLLRLLGGVIPGAWTVGLALGIDPPDCAACPRHGCETCAKSPLSP